MKKKTKASKEESVSEFIIATQSFFILAFGLAISLARDANHMLVVGICVSYFGIIISIANIIRLYKNSKMLTLSKTKRKG